MSCSTTCGGPFTAAKFDSIVALKRNLPSTIRFAVVFTTPARLTAVQV